MGRTPAERLLEARLIKGKRKEMFKNIQVKKKTKLSQCMYIDKNENLLCSVLRDNRIITFLNYPVN